MKFPRFGFKHKRQQFYSILFFSDSDERPRGVKLSRKALIVYISLIVIFIVVVTLVVVIHTPVKYIVFPETFVESRERAKRMQELYGRLENFAYELEKVKLYNNLLRQALGEKVSDSIAANISRLESLSQKAKNFVESDVDVLQIVDIEHEKPRFIFPVYNGFITREFNPDIQHYGIDIAAKEGDIIRAVDDGYVIFSDWTYRDGYVTILLHGDGYISVYKHAMMNFKAKNVFVKRGDVIALIGKTGKLGNEPHLHFELWKNGKPLNPKFYITNY